jgi:L-alanine-DL-glutamate epimerase-like enolase superfamily enzyme
MLIRSVKLFVVPGEPGLRQVRSQGTIERVPPGLGLFTHSAGIRAERPGEAVQFQSVQRQPTFNLMLRLETGEGISPFTTLASGYSAEELEWQAKSFLANVAPLLVGVDAFDREYVWQRLWIAQRFFYTGRSIIDSVDNMLWDFASRHARQPIYRLLGGCRDRVPAYRNIGGTTIDELVADAVKAKQQGFKGCKDHSYRGVKANIELARELRAAVGNDFQLMHDAVWSYTFDDAVRVGRALERYGYAWMEEPLMDYDLLGSKKLCEALDLPIMAMEWIGAVGGQPYTASAYLALRATDLVRQRAVGITGQLKLAQLAESFGVAVHGGNQHVVVAISNDPIYEALGWEVRPESQALNVVGSPVVENGYLSIAWSNQPAPEPDWDDVSRTAVKKV